jgi:hypothetical protein
MADYRAQSMGGSGLKWERKGYFGNGNVEPLFDTLSGRRALVVGSGWGVFDEFRRYASPECVVFAVNDVGVYLPRIDHLVSLHADKLRLWRDLRANTMSQGYGNTDFKTHTGFYAAGGIDYCWEYLTPIFALSGYFAMQIAYLMGAEWIFLLGCPGDSTPRFWETETVNKSYQQQGVLDQLKHEMKRNPDFFNRVRSASGFTRRFFGGIE